MISGGRSFPVSNLRTNARVSVMRPYAATHQQRIVIL